MKETQNLLKELGYEQTVNLSGDGYIRYENGVGTRILLLEEKMIVLDSDVRIKYDGKVPHNIEIFKELLKLVTDE